MGQMLLPHENFLVNNPRVAGRSHKRAKVCISLLAVLDLVLNLCSDTGKITEECYDPRVSDRKDK